MRFSFLSLLALLALVVVAPACGKNKQVSFELSIPSALVADTVWFEIGAYENASCSGITPMLQNGVPQTATTRVAFRADDRSAPTIGDLNRGTYAFAAVAKGDDCRVLALGCTEVDVADADSVEISLKANDPPTGACAVGASCQAALCVPSDDNTDPSIGAGCSLELLGAGPLPNPIGGEDTLVSAPAIAATPTGFVIAYKEIDPNGTDSRLTLQPIDFAGGALEPTRPTLKGRCSNSSEFDGVGLAMNGADGQVVLARAACGDKPGLELYAFHSDPAVTADPNFQTTPSSTSTSLRLSNSHVLAGGLVVYVDDGVSRVSTVVVGKGVTNPVGTFGGTAGMTGAWAAASDKVLALLAAGPPGATNPTDGGMDAGDAGDAGNFTPDPTTPDNTPRLGLVLVPAGTSAGSFDAASGSPRVPITFGGSWGAVGALGTRVIVLSDGSGPGRSVSYRAFDLDKTAAVVDDGFSVDGAGSVATGDVTMIDDKAFFAVLKPAGVSLHVFAGASTTPRLLRQVTFATEPRIPSLTTVRDGRVAVAATSSRVGVVWTTASKLVSNDTSGGYAVFACTP